MKNLKLFEDFVPELNRDQWIDSEWRRDEMPAAFRVTPSNISRLENDEVFVFGSNLQGIHTQGAARFAINNGFADEGQKNGPSRNGKSYAIPTQDNRQSLPLNEIKKYVDQFLEYAKSNPDKKFYVTKLGTGYAGYREDQISILFSKAPEIGNVYLPEKFLDSLGIYR